MATQQQIIEAFYRLYQAYHNKRFTKSLKFSHKTEKEILPLVRNYLLGYFDSLEPEAMTNITTNYRSRFDFLIDDVVAVELAIRSANKGEYNLKAQKNENEVKKLIKHPNHSLLILFDFKGYRTDQEVKDTLIEYRNIPSLGRGNHHRYPFTVSYFYQDETGELFYQTRRIRVKRRIISLNCDENIAEKINIISQKELSAREYDAETKETIQWYKADVRVKGNELTIEYKNEDGSYNQYKGTETEVDSYRLTSTENPNNYAIVSLFTDEDDMLVIEGTLIEDNYKKEWLIESEMD